MADIQAQQAGQTASSELKEKVGSGKSLEAALGALARFGGFAFLETAIDGVQNMNPERKARKKMFLVEEQKKGERKELANKIELWIDLLTNSKDIPEMVEQCEAKISTVGGLLAKNQLAAVEAVKDLEKSYRAIQLFYKNTEEAKLSNISVMNASMEQLTDLDNSRFIDHVADELKQNYDRLDLRGNYGLLVVPGYLGSNKVLDKWSKIANSNKVMLFTDFADLDHPDDVVDMFTSADHAGGDTYKSNTVMCCNWLVGRSAYKELLFW